MLVEGSRHQLQLFFDWSPKNLNQQLDQVQKDADEIAKLFRDSNVHRQPQALGQREREREEQLRQLQNQPEPLTNQQQTAAAEVDRNDFFQSDRHYQAVLTMIRENAAWAIHTDQPHTARSKFVISWEFLSYASSTTCDL